MAVIAAIKNLLKRYWPPLKLRTILFGTLLFTAALPGVGAVFLRVYENTLVRQTEAELVAQGAALAATAQALWPGSTPAADAPTAAAREDPPDENPYDLMHFNPEAPTVDLRSTPVLGERPPAQARNRPVDAAAATTAQLLLPIVAATKRTTLASVALLDRNGNIVLGHEAGGSYANVPEVMAALHGQTRTVLRENGAYAQRYAFEWLSRASSLRIHHVRPIVVNGRIVGAVLLSRSPRALFRGLYEDRGKILIGVVVIFLILLVLAGLVSRGIARPIEALGIATRGVAAGTGEVPETPVTAAIEIRALFENFRAMAAAINRRSRYLRDFAASVSHEFKTPLAGISGAIELLEDHGEAMTPAERERFLGNIKADAERLSQLVGRLLDLARADMAQPDPGAAVDVMEVARQVADGFHRDGFAVAVAEVSDLPKVAVPVSTVEAVLNTLLENARQAGADRVVIGAAVRGGAVALCVTDNGRGIPAGDAERIFEPFFTTRRASGGTGLGLAISASLLRAGGGEIALDEAPAKGTRFVVTLPVAGLR
jgi:signal transduction histidine kinase